MAICPKFSPLFLQGDSSGSMSYIYYVVRQSMAWMCCVWYLLMFSLVLEDFIWTWLR